MSTSIKQKGYKSGEKVTYRTDGAGVTSYATDEVTHMHGGKLFTNSYSSMGMDWNGHTYIFSGMGLSTTLVPNDDPAALAYFAENGDENEPEEEEEEEKKKPKVKAKKRPVKKTAVKKTARKTKWSKKKKK